jgi:ATP-dependent DNA helicase RecQ
LALLFYRSEDLGLARFFTTGRPDEQLLRAAYDAMDGSRPAKLKQLRERLETRGRKLTNAINMLDECGAVRSTRKGFLRTDMSTDAAVAEAVQAVGLRERVDLSRVEMMRGYAETAGCRRVFLLSYFGEHVPGACGNCDRCLEAERLDDVMAEQPALPVDTVVRHREWGSGVVIGGDHERITVLFEDFGYRALSMAAVREHGLLEITEAVAEPA